MAGKAKEFFCQGDELRDSGRAGVEAGLAGERGQIGVSLNPDDDATATWIEYTVWATVSGPLAGLPSRQIENALREGADEFFAEFCEVVRAKHALPSMRAYQMSRARMAANSFIR